MEELIVNLHMHTTYSDGSGSHADIARAALSTEVDVVIVTDHNVLVKGVEGYHSDDHRRILLLVGEEVHDQGRDPQKNHLLVMGASRELATFAPDPQRLIDQVQRAGGVCFIAHPRDPALPAFHEPDISWVDWNVYGYQGIELWNGFSELKTVIHNQWDSLFYAFNPQYIATGPIPQVLEKWDELTGAGERIAAVGGSDAHALDMHLGPIHRTIFPYQFHFQTINTHILVPNGLAGDLNPDRSMVYDALAKGHSFIGYDLPASTRGFRFMATGKDATVSMGEEIQLNEGLTFQIRLPMKAECQLIHNGKVARTWRDREICAFNANQPGVYRVEVYIEFLGKRRGWIFSNPIYVRASHPVRNRVQPKR
jgi:hypothetical protein